MIQLVASLTINPDETDALEEYFNVAMPLIERVGAKVSQKIELGEPVVGEPPSKLIMLVDYPNKEAVEKVFKSAEYASIIPARDRAFLNYNICLVSNNEWVDGFR